MTMPVGLDDVILLILSVDAFSYHHGILKRLT